MRITHAAASLASVLCLLTLAACGRAGTSARPGAGPASPPAATNLAAATPGSAYQPPDWQTLAAARHNMNAARGVEGYAVIRVQPQTPVALAAGPGGQSGAPQVPPTAALPGARHTSSFTPADLIKDGGAFDVSLSSNLLAPDGTDPSVGRFKCNTDPNHPATQQMAYGMYRFTLTGYAASGQPQSIGTLWETDNAPNRYFIGLSNWQTGRWDWFEGSPDDVVTVATLTPYIRSGDDTLLAAVVALDTQFRGLLLLQVGADEVRGLGGIPPDSEAGMTFVGPDDYFPGKTASTLPPAFQLNEDKFGAIYDQGHSLMCTACASAALCNYEFATTYAPYWRPADAGPPPTQDMRREFSPKWLYRQTGLGACFYGRAGDWILGLLKDVGGATLVQAPFNTNCDTDYNVPACTTEAAFLRIADWRAIHCTGQVAIDEIRNQLANLSHPVLISLTVNDHLTGGGGNGPWDGSQTFHWDGSLPSVFLSHTMVITGYDDARQAFRVRNSWGSGWGDGGSFWLGYDNFMSGPAIYGCFVVRTDYAAATAAHFNLTGDFAIPPAGATCTSPVPGMIHLSWSPVNLATGYAIYRDSLSNQLTIAGGSTTSYDDAGVTDFFAHTYFIRTLVGSSLSYGSTQARGWLTFAAPPRITSISHTRLGSGQMQFVAHVDNPDPAAALSYSWGFPAGSILEVSPQTLRSPTVTLDQPGSFLGSLTVTNSGGSAQLDFTFSVYALASAPAALFSVPPVIHRNSLTHFDGAASTAELGAKVAHYYWDWDGDGYSDFDSAGSDLAHIFTVAGSASLGLKVVDDRGLESKWASQSFTVLP